MGRKSEHVPMRSCVGCRGVRPKAELLRLVRSPDGRFRLDPQKRLPGRGAYVCWNLECVQRAGKRKALHRAFRCTVPEEFYREVTNYVTGCSDQDG